MLEKRIISLVQEIFICLIQLKALTCTFQNAENLQC